MRSTTARPSSARRSRRDWGFTLIELVVAILLIDVAVLAVVRTHAIVVRERNLMRMRSAAVNTAATRLEQQLAAPCAAASGSSSLPAASEHWSASFDGHTREIGDSVVFGVTMSHIVVLRTRLPC
jgi:Tfp pilus assembly protein PilV